MVHSKRPQAPISPSEQQTAEYTYDMLTSLRELATARGHEALALLLSAAADEARTIAKAQKSNGDAASGET